MTVFVVACGIRMRGCEAPKFSPGLNISFLI